VLQDQAVDAESVIKVKGFVSQKFRRDCDFVDLVRADTVTAAQVVTTGVLIFANDPGRIGVFETYTMSSYALLNEERREILADIAQRGSIYG
jgi:uncharacterized protein